MNSCTSTGLSKNERGLGGPRRSDVSLWAEYLPQADASAFLAEVCGLTIAPKTLQKRRVIGGGPPFVRMVSRVFYPRAPLEAWGVAQRSPQVNSTSELNATAA